VRLALRQLAYIEGQNIAIEYRYAQPKRNQYSGLAADLVRLKVDAIVLAGGTSTDQAAKNATKTKLKRWPVQVVSQPRMVVVGSSLLLTGIGHEKR
jgi:hypothetical protein